MKKFILLIASVFPLFSIQAQDYKPDARGISVEVNFTPFTNPPLSIDYIKARYFINQSIAVRTGFSLAFDHNTVDNYTTQNAFQLSIVPGIEKHFKGTDKLSPYIGAEIDLGLLNSGTTSTADGNTVTVTGAWTDSTGKVSNRGYFRFGLNAVAGVDYYFTQHFYAGLEIAYGFRMISSSDVYSSEAGSDVDKGGTSISFGPSINHALRLGFIF